MISALCQKMASVVSNMATVIKDFTDTTRQPPPTATATDKTETKHDLVHEHGWILVYVYAEMVASDKGSSIFQSKMGGAHYNVVILMDLENFMDICAEIEVVFLLNRRMQLCKSSSSSRPT